MMNRSLKNVANETAAIQLKQIQDRQAQLHAEQKINEAWQKNIAIQVKEQNKAEKAQSEMRRSAYVQNQNFLLRKQIPAQKVFRTVESLL